MSVNLLVFDSHPVQYRVPVWQTMEKLKPGSVHVAYASDCSVRGHMDKEFGHKVAWDTPMLSGYPHSILNCESGVPLSGWGTLTGEGVARLIRQLKPSAVLLTGFNYRFDLVAYMAARKQRVPVWLRCETQDHALKRSKVKSVLRSIIYHIAYLAIDRVFYIGELNKMHYLKHAVGSFQLKPARYGTEDRFEGMDRSAKSVLRTEGRNHAGIAADAFVIGFSGKLITKKNPDILYEMLDHLAPALRKKTTIYFMGSGELLDELQQLATIAFERFGVGSYFSGFVNQSQLAAHYLVMDIMVLPSRKMGETWGLVANEAMQAGCGVIVSDAVGCSKDFARWERFRVFPEGDAADLAVKVESLSVYTRDFDWATEKLKAYSIEATAESLLNELTT
jgi:glycosyltransferase involved in cell wall biosynthesis